MRGDASRGHPSTDGGDARARRVVAHVTELALARKLSSAERLARFRPGIAPASWKTQLRFVAGRGAPRKDAISAHKGIAHHDVEPRLSLT